MKTEQFKPALFNNQYLRISIYENICRSPETTLLSRLDGLMEQYCSKEKEACFYAKKLGYSIKTLNSITVFHTGNTVYRILQDALLSRAQSLILYSKLPAKLIAYELGFSSPAYFCRWFKKVTAMTPKEYKIKMIINAINLE